MCKPSAALAIGVNIQSLIWKYQFEIQWRACQDVVSFYISSLGFYSICCVKISPLKYLVDNCGWSETKPRKLRWQRSPYPKPGPPGKSRNNFHSSVCSTSRLWTEQNLFPNLATSGHNPALRLPLVLAEARWQPDLEFVKKFTRPNFQAKEFYTLKTRKSRLFLPAINSENASLSVIYPSFG